MEGKDKHNHLSILPTVTTAKHWQDWEYYKDDKVADKSIAISLRELPVDFRNNTSLFTSLLFPTSHSARISVDCSTSGQREDYAEVNVTDETADFPLGC